MSNRTARFRPADFRPRCRLWLSALIWLFTISNQAAWGESIPERLLPGLAEAGRLCLAAEHERDIAPALALIRSMKAELVQANASQAEASRIESALDFLLKWQTYLAYRNDEYWGSAGAMVMHLSNLPVAHLMMRRSEIRERLTKMPREETGPPAPPLNVHRRQDLEDERDAFDLIWTNAADDAEYCVIERDDKYGEYSEIAILPPTIENYYPFPRDAKASSPEADVVRRAADACLRAVRIEELDPVLKELASFWRGARSDVTRSERAEQSRIDCALLFVGWWQDSLAELHAGNKERAARILRRLAATNRDYPVLEPQVILERASAADPNVNDFVADSNRQN
jgi:hypothetical protein